VEAVSLQIKSRSKDKKIAKSKCKAKETVVTGLQAQNDALINSPGGSLGAEGSSRPRRTLRTRAPSNLNPLWDSDPGMDIDDDKHVGDRGLDVDGEAAFTGRTSTRKGSKKYKENGYCLGPKDPANFLKLASALNIFLSDALTDNQIDEADKLIREYNVELIEVSRILCTLPVFAVLNFPALWARRNKAKSPLLNPHSRVYT
jgi:hypothetical protein